MGRDEKNKSKKSAPVAVRCLSGWSLALIAAAAVIGSVPPGALGEHAGDTVGPQPTGTFSADILIVVNDGYKVGRLVNVECVGNASDWDHHKDASTCELAADTFDGADAYKWVISDLNPTTPLNLTGKTVTFQTKNALGSGDIIMKVKDDALHKRDFTENTQVASILVTIVDPDAIRIVSQSGQITVNNDQWVIGATPVVWQLRYGGKDLPWAGQVQEQVTVPINSYTNVQPATPQQVTGGWQDLATWTCSNIGRFTDNHSSTFYKPLPDAGRFHVKANQQKFKNLEAEGDPLFGATFTDYEYIDSTPTFTHDES